MATADAMAEAMRFIKIASEVMESQVLTLIGCFIAIAICLCGDRLLKEKIVSDKFLFRSIVDNATHGSVGAVSWAATVISKKSYSDWEMWLEIFIAGASASFIDIDHFIGDTTYKLRDEKYIKGRPFLHSSSILIIIVLFCFYCQKYSPHLIDIISKNLPWILVVAWSSHHVRDAQRRGLWFSPFGSTSPIPYILYICITFFIPIFVKLLMSYTCTNNKNKAGSIVV